MTDEEDDRSDKDSEPECEVMEQEDGRNEQDNEIEREVMEKGG